MRNQIDMKMEIKVNGKMWIEAELKEQLGKSMIKQLDEVFTRIVKDKNKDQIIGFSRNPKVLE